MRWAQLTLVEDDPGKFDPQFWLDYFKRTKSDAVCLSAGGCVAYYPDRRFRSTIAARGWATATRSANWSRLPQARHGRHRAHRSARDLRRRAGRRIPTGSHVDAEGQPRRHWASPEMWVTCGLGPYNFEFMTEVKREIMSRYQRGRHFHQPLGRLGDVLLRALPEKFQRRVRLRACRARTIRKIRRAAPTSSGGSSGSSICGGSGTPRCARSIPTRVHPEHRRRRDQLARHEEHRRARAHADGRPSGAAALMPPWANGKNGKEYRATMGRKPIVGIFSVGLEEPYRWKDSVQSDAEIRLWVARRRRQRPAAVVHQVRRHAARPALAETGRGHLSPVVRGQRALSAQRAAAGARRPGLFAADRVVLRRRESRGPHQRLVSGADRGARPVRDGARPAARRRASRAVQDAHPAEHRRAVRRAMRPAPRVRRARRQPRRHARDVALRRMGRPPRKDFGLADLFGVSFTGRTEGRCTTPISGSSTTPRPGHPLLARTRRRAAHHPRRLAGRLVEPTGSSRSRR